MTRRKLLLFLVKIIVSFLVLWAVYTYLGSAETWEKMQNASMSWILAGAVCVVCVQVAKAWRFREFTRVLGQSVPFSRCLLAHLIVPILGFVTPGKLGEGAKVFYLKTSKRELGFLFIVERIQDMLILLAVAGFGFAFSEFYVLSYLVLLGAVAVGFGLFLRLDWFLNRITRILLKKQYFTENWFMEKSRALLRPRFIAASALTLLVWGITFGSSYCFARAVAVDLSYPKVALVFSWAVIMGLVSSLPGGVGVREGGITVFFEKIYGVARPAGTAVAAINLAVHYIVLTLTAAIGYLIYKSIEKDS
ncbi:MAG TPA: lysylphosphatidylglycerol synthase transmembrane domain-containing protein [bacterium]|nr:lysylphosphatidylglycerol synthase transmembrane domain-containing protein [bacterium]